MEEIDGRIILIDKPSGMTSFGVVARVRRQLTEQQRQVHEGRGFCTEIQRKEGASSADERTNEYVSRATQQTDAAVRSEPRGEAGLSRLQAWRCKCRVKVGHCGTLDPFATGLLILVTGKQTKNAGEFMKKDKVYEATIRLGQVSTTGDPEGEITNSPTERSDKYTKGLTLNRVKTVLEGFVGEIEQTPPMFSAIKINGQRAYKLARRGEVVEIPKRTVTIYSLELLDYSYPELRIRVHVSSGTYIRSLAIDIGTALGTGAYCSELRRVSIAEWNVVDATHEFDHTF